MSDFAEPYVLSIHAVDGRPEGIRIAEMDNWPGRAIAFSRFDAGRARSRPEMLQAGVYVLMGTDATGGLQVYIGESDDLRGRLAAHDGSRGKDFWDGAVVLTSPELNKAHVRWLEAELVKLAQASGRAEITNLTDPQPATLSEAEQTRVKSFLARALKLLPLLGVNAFEGSGADPVPGGAIPVSLAKAGASASGLYSSEGLRVLAGSTARMEHVPSMPLYLIAMRNRMVEAGVLAVAGDSYVFTRDHLFTSPSAASGAVMARTSNGQNDWSLADGQPLGSLRATDEPDPPIV